MKATKKNFQQYLDEIKEGYGRRLRRRDPIAFEVGYREWCREIAYLRIRKFSVGRIQF